MIHFTGAGKTTLIELLANKNKTGYTSGSVRFPPDPSRESRTPHIGFVSQQDVLPPMLTVKEAILFAARLRLPEYVTDAEKRQRVDDVIEQLSLTHIRDSRIGGRTTHAHGISGGEMRRVSIGLELVSCPDVLILDEPTSGSFPFLSAHGNKNSNIFFRPRFSLCLKSCLSPPRSCARHGQPDRRDRDHTSAKFTDLSRL